MMKMKSVALTAALAVSLAACGSPPAQNNATAENAAVPPPEVTANETLPGNAAAAEQIVNEAAPATQNTAAAPARPAEPPRRQPAPKAEPAPRPPEPVDPHAGHDMGNMQHNQSGSSS